MRWGMPIESDDRESDSPYVARVWRGRTAGVECMTSVATSTWELVFWEDGGVVHAGVRGPETAASAVEVVGDSESFGITFTHGTSMPHLPIAGLVDGDLESPHVTESTFVLRSEEWEIPDFDDAEQFVDKLVRAGVLVRDPLVDEVVWGGIARVGSRSVQRRVAAATGLTQGAIRQIERAREAALLIGEGIAAARRRASARLLRPAAPGEGPAAVHRPHRDSAATARRPRRSHVAPVQERGPDHSLA